MSDEEAFRREVEVLGFGDSGEDVVVGLWSSDRERYAFSGDIEEEELTEFVQVRMPPFCLVYAKLYSSSPSVCVVYCISLSCITLNTVCLNILFIVCNTIHFPQHLGPYVLGPLALSSSWCVLPSLRPTSLET